MADLILTAPVVHTREQCHYCSRFFVAGDLIRWVKGTIRICETCHDRHCKALAVMGGAPPPDGCQECGAPWPHKGNGNYSMHIAAKDGMYQVLCQPCAVRYVSQRRDLYPHATP